MPSHIWICPHCFNEETGPKEFKTEEEYKKHMEKHSRGITTAPRPKKAVLEAVVAPPKLPEAPEPVDKDRKEVELTYKYVGNCNVCGKEVDTIPLELDKRTGKVIIVAWCSACKSNKAYRSVAKL